MELAAYSPVGLDAGQLEANRKEIREGFRLFLSVTGVDGTQLHGSISTVFESPNFPEEVKTVFFDSGIPLKNRNYFVGNRCALFLDFSRPDILNFSLMPSWQTPNDSNIEVQGLNATWVNGVFHEIVDFVRERPSTLGWLHRHTVYDVLLWALGFPLAFWCCYRASGLVRRVLPGPFLQSAAYLYLALVALVLFRILFHYARWIWPLLEYRHARSRAVRHKAFWIFLVGGVFVNFLWNLIHSV
jgi:hypothetical protein